MVRYIALLRGINVSGRKLIKMEDLREHFKMPGFKNIVTYIQSGNVLFDTSESDEALLRKKIEQRLLKKTGFEVTVILRKLEEIGSAVKCNPFLNTGDDDARKLYVSFLEGLPDKKLCGTLENLSTDAESVKVLNREVYLITRGYGDSLFSNNFVEKKLGLAATTRNWATVNKVLEL
jgi:uncharacterized protein (DUF1697 family)